MPYQARGLDKNNGSFGSRYFLVEHTPFELYRFSRSRFAPCFALQNARGAIFARTLASKLADVASLDFRGTRLSRESAQEMQRISDEFASQTSRFSHSRVARHRRIVVARLSQARSFNSLLGTVSLPQNNTQLFWDHYHRKFAQSSCKELFPAFLLRVPFSKEKSQIESQGFNSGFLCVNTYFDTICVHP